MLLGIYVTKCGAINGPREGVIIVRLILSPSGTVGIWDRLDGPTAGIPYLFLVRNG